MGVIDILPHCVSSVYFMYEKKWERFSLGRVGCKLYYRTCTEPVLRSVLLEKHPLPRKSMMLGYPI